MRKRSFFRALLGTVLLCTFGLANRLSAQDIPITTQNDDAQSVFVQGRELFDNLRIDEARQRFEEALQKDPNFAMAHLYLALSSTRDADFDTHLASAVKAVDEVSDGEKLVIKSVKANAKSNPMKAVAKLKEAAQLYPEDKRVHHMLGLAYQGANMNQEAVNEYKKAIDIDANFAPPYNNLGYIYRDEEKFADAEQAFKDYIRLLPEEANPHDSIADLYTKMGNYDSAIEHYQQALTLNPRFYFSQQKIGDNLVFKGKFDEGRQAYQKAMEITPDLSNKIYMQQGLACTWLYEDNFDKAREENSMAIKWAEENSLPENAATIYQMQALADIENGRFEEADADMKASDKIVSSQNLTENRKHNIELLSLRNQAIKAAKQGNFEQAMDFADDLRQKAEISTNPNEMKTYNAVAGIVFYEQGDYDNAIKKLEESNFRSPYAQFYLAESYQKAGKTAEGKKAYEKVAHWNEHSLEYALVRKKAMIAANMRLAIE